MKYTGLIIHLWSIMWLLISCRKNRICNINTKKILKRTGNAVAVDHLIQEYEREHHKFHEQGSENDDYLKWPDPDKINLSIYCRKYLQYSLPTRTNESATGTKIAMELHYKGENTSIINFFGIRCELIHKTPPTYYYITRAPQLNCVFALQCTRSQFICHIINKYCDFENKPLINRTLKRKWVELINKIHTDTGQPIAKDEYILEYELEHQTMFKRERNDRCIEWPHARKHHNLDAYCYQYIGACAPRRNLETVTGSLKYEKLQYMKLGTNEVIGVTIVICQLSTVSKRSYYITQAPERKCVYALFRRDRSVLSPFIIIFKHCDFEDPNDQTIPKYYDILDRNVITKTEVKEDTPLKTLYLLPNN